MAVSASIASIKNIIGHNKGGAKSGTRVSGGLPKDQALEPVPSVGFRVGYVRNTSKIKVHVMGARHLPAKVGNTSVSCYTVKVKLFPGTKRCETEGKPESWPVYDQHFTFDLAVCSDKRTRRQQQLGDILAASNFLVFTICAVDSSGKKRNIGAATWPLDHALFRHKPLSLSFGDNEELETPDIWRKAQEMSSGIAGAKQAREAKNNQLEVSLCYNAGNAEEGESDTLVVMVRRLRWSIESTREYQQQNALLYVKLNVLEDGVGSIKACKTQRFPPSISVHFNAERDNSTLTTPLPPVRRDHLVCQLSLCTRTRLGKKTLLGRVNIGPTMENSAEHLEQALQSPGLAITQWHSLVKEELR